MGPGGGSNLEIPINERNMYVVYSHVPNICTVIKMLLSNITNLISCLWSYQVANL